MKSAIISAFAGVFLTACVGVNLPNLSNLSLPSPKSKNDQIAKKMPKNSKSSRNSSANSSGNEFLNLVNNARKTPRKCGSKYFAAASPLKWNQALQSAANSHAKDMAKNGFFSHTGSDGSTLSSRFARAGYKAKAAAENIAKGQTSAQSALNSWLKSPGHCANLMSADYTEFGMARSGNLWVQTFGRR